MSPTELYQLAAVAGGVVGTGLLGFLFVRRARAARRRMIDATDEGPSPRELPKRPKTSARELLEPEEPAPSEGPAVDVIDAGSVVERRSAPEPIAARPAQVLPFAASATAVVPIARSLNIPVEKPFAAPVVKTKKDTAALSNGLARTRSSGFIAGLGALFAGRKELDPSIVEGLEKVLLTADIGVRTSQKLLEEIRSSLSRKELANPEAIWTFLRKRSAQLLEQDIAPVDFKAKKPFVLLTIGVNGSGKTTTIGKLAAKLVASGHKVLLAAGDTFRAAAAEQLEIWAGRTGATLVRGKEGADPSSVIFDAVKRGVTEGYDVVIADTAGRLHTKTDLMQELQKVRRVIDKASPGAPHETWLVIDSTSGQNAIAQAQIFTKDMQVSGIVLTKLDGTAKGGVILGIVDQLKLPVRYVGIGERVEDLREFDAEEFVEALFEPPSPSPSPLLQ
ncbi:MAG TPA: signal recognition particle-docking protein FtsY [Polyangia bacterium]|nr:signal recognition particle-docking protein FtsY [Polyangia bacterium]